MIQGLSMAVGIVSLLCYFYVLYQMYEHAETVIAIVCLVGLCVLGLGYLVAFVYGWIKAREWETVPVMAVWSGAIGLNIVLAVVNALMQGA